jgi:hypothetical protein
MTATTGTNAIHAGYIGQFNKFAMIQQNPAAIATIRHSKYAANRFAHQDACLATEGRAKTLLDRVH